MYMKRKDWNVVDIMCQLRSIHRQAASPFNDGFVARDCKKDLFSIKCLVEDLYADTPNFVGEDAWHEERTLDLLKKNR